MDNIDIEINRLIDLSDERFFEHIEELYGELVVKILKYHDIDRYTILSHVDKHQLIDFFEKPNDEHSTSELINLKKERTSIDKAIFLPTIFFKKNYIFGISIKF